MSRSPGCAGLIPPGATLAAIAFCLITSWGVCQIRAADDSPVTKAEANRGFRTRTLLAKPRGGAAIDVTRAENAAGVRLVREHARFGGLRTLETDGTVEVKDVVAQLSATGLYDYVEPDFIRVIHALPDDPKFAGDQWSLNNTGQAGGTTGADIRAVPAWEIQRDAPDVIVGVMDTGLLMIHDDLASNLWTNAGEQSQHPAIDDDGDGYIDDLHGIDATVAKTSFTAGDPSDEEGHGTHVAGIIGAVGNNGVGVTGIAWKTQIMGLKFMGRNGGSISGIVACVDYAIAKGVKIINASYGGGSFSQGEYDALKRARDAGIIVVASAGNDSQEINDLPEYPAAYLLDNIVAVASTTRQDKLASYSTFGSGLVELAAPGSSILSLGISATAPYAVKSGTSMAAPHVTGALALLRQRFPNDSYRALINRVLSSVDVLPALDHKVQTNGRLNLLRALSTTDTRPFNDDFTRRAVITGDTNTIRASNQFATMETGEPNHGVTGTTGSLWWSWTAPVGTGKVTISTAGSAIDTVVAIYTEPTGTAPANLATLPRIAFNDDDPAGGTASNLTFNATEGTTYAIAIAGKAAAEGFVTFSLSTVPLNDAFAQARPLTGASVVVAGNNANATDESGEPHPKSARGTVLGVGHSLWYKWTAPETRPYQISAFEKATDPLVSIYTGASLTTLSEVAFDDDSGPFFDSLVRFTATAGVTYFIRVDSSFGTGGGFTLSLADAAWQYVTDYPLYASPAVAPNGTLYLADGVGLVHAINPDGTRKWRSMAVDGFIFGGAIAVAADGTLYAADDFGVMYALDPDTGAKKWSFTTGELIWTAPAVAADGTIYVRSNDEQLYAISATGTEKWRFPIPGDTYASPSIAADGTIYIGSGGDNYLYALNPDGTQKWRFALAASVYGSPAIGADGTIYLGNYDGRFFAIRPDGTERWHFDTGSPLSTSAVLDTRGYVYFGSYDKKLYALDATTGTKKWDYTTGDTIRSTAPLVADDGTIYIGSGDGIVHAVNPDGTLRRTFATAEAILAAPVIAAGRLYVASGDAKLYAFDIGANLAHSAWPMHRHDLRRDGRPTDPAGIPSITSQPVVSATATAGNPLSLTTAANAGTDPVTYQWLFNNAPIAGATASTLSIASAQGADAGAYRVLVTGPGGSIVSTATTLSVTTSAATTSRLINLAVRTNAGGGDKVLFVGFVIGGANTSGSKPLLIRGVGPTLGAFGITGALADPKIDLFQGGAGTPFLTNDDWAGDAQITAIMPQLGAFGFASATSKDAAVLTTRTAGSYTAQLSASTSGGQTGADSGVALAEIYDATTVAFTATTPRLINVSARTQVGTDNDILIAGFVIGGTGSKTVMIRAVGPTLGVFGVPGVLVDPKLDLFQNGASAAISSNDDWGKATNAVQIATAAASVGAFGLPLESKDAVLLVTLPPGTYTAQVSGVNRTTGAALVEVYEIP